MNQSNRDQSHSTHEADYAAKSMDFHSDIAIPGVEDAAPLRTQPVTTSSNPKNLNIPVHSDHADCFEENPFLITRKTPPPIVLHRPIVRKPGNLTLKTYEGWSRDGFHILNRSRPIDVSWNIITMALHQGTIAAGAVVPVLQPNTKITFLFMARIYTNGFHIVGFYPNDNPDDIFLTPCPVNPYPGSRESAVLEAPGNRPLMGVAPDVEKIALEFKWSLGTEKPEPDDTEALFLLVKNYVEREKARYSDRYI